MPQQKQPVTIEDIRAVQAAIARDPDPQTAYRAFDAVVTRTYGHKLLTVLRLIEDVMEVERLYSSHLDAYPLAGRKKKQGTAWGKKLFERGELHFCMNSDDIRETFFDHELIMSLGIGGMVNVPIPFGGRLLGTVNISHDAGHFTPSDEPQLRLLAGLLVPLLLTAK